MTTPHRPPPNLIPDELRQYIGDINPNARLPRHRVAMMLALMAKTLQDQLSRPQFGCNVRVETRPDGFTLHADINQPQVIDDVQPG
jgi:hypothetical protein